MEFHPVDSGSIRCDVDTDAIRIYLSPNTDAHTLEYHAAHELSHVIAGCCGFSHIVSLTPEGAMRANQPNPSEGAIVVADFLQRHIGSFLTHAAVHSILLASGYDNSNMDSHIIEQVRERSNQTPNLWYRTAAVGWTIQYEELTLRNLPGLDHSLLEEFKSINRQWLPTFDDDLSMIRSASNIGDILDPEECLQSTKSLDEAFGLLLEEPVQDLLTIRLSCSPGDHWNLLEVIQRISTTHWFPMRTEQ